MRDFKERRSREMKDGKKESPIEQPRIQQLSSNGNPFTMLLINLLNLSIFICSQSSDYRSMDPNYL